MYPLLDSTTVTARAAESRRVADRARLARSTRARSDEGDTGARGVRHVLGMGLVRAGLRLIHA
jgi:hypothetical protein